MTDCLFCKIIAGDIPAEKLYEDDKVLAFKDVNAQAPEHFLVIPKAFDSETTVLLYAPKNIKTGSVVEKLSSKNLGVVV